MKGKLILLLSILSISVYSQIAPNVYLISLSDKNNSPYSINNPEEFLSERAIERRSKYDIPVIEQDLPVNPQYLDGLKKYASIHGKSKWLNSVCVIVEDISALDSIRALPFVSDIFLAYSPPSSKSLTDKLFVKSLKAGPQQLSLPDTSALNYGEAAHQIAMLNGHVLHNQNLQGQGMVIAVLDGGFTKANVNPAFDSLWLNNQILGGWDFVINKALTYSKHNHGAQVLSIMAANLPGKFVGSAPKAKYYLLRTESGFFEQPIEEENWISGAEYADSVGADLINSSLSYTKYNDPYGSHTYQDLDGNTTRITQAADIAASKGILVVTSAANYGESEWLYIGAPADADSALTVGAVDQYGNYAAFSSLGPSSDGRIKPNLTAQGEGTYFVGTDSEIYSGNGTSFSSPLLCGLAACLWQSKPAINNYDLIKLLEKTATQAENPDYKLGYGLPDFSKAFLETKGLDLNSLESNAYLKTYPNPFNDSFSVDYYSEKPEPYTIEIWDMLGNCIYKLDKDPGFSTFHETRVSGLHQFASGMYIIRVITPNSISKKRILKQKLDN